MELNSDGREEVRTQQGLGDPKGLGGDDKYTVRRPQEPQQEKKPIKIRLWGEVWLDGCALHDLDLNKRLE